MDRALYGQDRGVQQEQEQQQQESGTLTRRSLMEDSTARKSHWVRAAAGSNMAERGEGTRGGWSRSGGNWDCGQRVQRSEHLNDGICLFCLPLAVAISVAPRCMPLSLSLSAPAAGACASGTLTAQLMAQLNVYFRRFQSAHKWQPHSMGEISYQTSEEWREEREERGSGREREASHCLPSCSLSCTCRCSFMLSAILRPDQTTHLSKGALR